MDAIVAQIVVCIAELTACNRLPNLAVLLLSTEGRPMDGQAWTLNGPNPWTRDAFGAAVGDALTAFTAHSHSSRRYSSGVTTGNLSSVFFLRDPPATFAPPSAGMTSQGMRALTGSPATEQFGMTLPLATGSPATEQFGMTLPLATGSPATEQFGMTPFAPAVAVPPLPSVGLEPPRMPFATAVAVPEHEHHSIGLEQLPIAMAVPVFLDPPQGMQPGPPMPPPVAPTRPLPPPPDEHTIDEWEARVAEEEAYLQRVSIFVRAVGAIHGIDHAPPPGSPQGYLESRITAVNARIQRCNVIGQSQLALADALLQPPHSGI